MRSTPINEDVLWQSDPATACRANCDGINQAPRIVEERVAFIINSILADAIKKGTGTKARKALQRNDIRGKTGTTNDADIWFSGFTTDLVATVWAGFSDNSPLGRNEFGSTTPIETWISFMKEVLGPQSETTPLPTPDGLVTVRIDRDTGFRTDPQDPEGEFEIFRFEHAPADADLISKKAEEIEPLHEIFLNKKSAQRRFLKQER